MKAQEIRNLSLEELKDKLEELRKRLMELNFKKKTAHVEKPHQFKQIKKDIARILTVIKEKQK
ncbi:MAG: 50S ribosomal protein L29 [Candidatus Omnitrophota bacterium]|nr:50S ribosomal protein L29 [Candidatus Omnitrophota bacterium]RKY33992.1 MAG: 50S ribosomal protein L29 [Candidatus Omnitrophota bacterium]HDN85630.1 50S ribosomal protein L29 [Candidatus Omnitrophota bacterium]